MPDLRRVLRCARLGEYQIGNIYRASGDAKPASLDAAKRVACHLGNIVLDQSGSNTRPPCASGGAVDERQQSEVEALLRQGAWFGNLPEALQQRILARSVLRVFSKGEALQLEQGRIVGLVAVLEGQVSVLRHAADEVPVLFYVAGPGYWFGELTVLAGVAPAVTVVAQTVVKVLVLTKAEFDRIVGDDLQVYRAFMQIVFERHQILMRFLAETVRLSPDSRLRLRLADLADVKRAEAVHGGLAVALTMTQSELAELIGLSRQKLNVRLRRLRDEGWVELRPRRIIVRDPSGLRASAATALAADL